MALLDTYPLDVRIYGFEWLRRMFDTGIHREGVVAAGDLAVTAAAAGGMRVDVAAGACLIRGDTGFRNGLYLQVNDAAIANAVTLDGSHATLPRLDRIILRVNDSSDLGSATDVPALEKVTGVPTAGATIANGLGMAAMPADAIELARVLVPAASVAVTAGNISDQRVTAVIPQAVGPTILRKAVDEPVNNSVALQDDDTLVLPVAANEEWEVDIKLLIQAVSAAADWKVGFSGPAGAAFYWGPEAREAATFYWTPKAVAATPDTLLTLADSLLVGSSANTITGLHLMGIIRNAGTAGNLVLRWAQNTATASDNKVLAGSVLKAFKTTA